jgi:hypothetical protein
MRENVNCVTEFETKVLLTVVHDIIPFRLGHSIKIKKYKKKNNSLTH